jgi:hypothetical protein
MRQASETTVLAHPVAPRHESTVHGWPSSHSDGPSSSMAPSQSSSSPLQSSADGVRAEHAVSTPFTQLRVPTQVPCGLVVEHVVEAPSNVAEHSQALALRRHWAGPPSMMEQL